MRKLLLLILLVVLGVGAWLYWGGGLQVVTEHSVRVALVEAGVPEKQAECMAPRMAERLSAWLEAGYHGSMGWMERDPSVRSGPQGMWPEVRDLLREERDRVGPIRLQQTEAPELRVRLVERPEMASEAAALVRGEEIPGDIAAEGVTEEALSRDRAGLV